MVIKNETCLDLYAGMGGFGTGFSHYFNVLDAVDISKDACRTYEQNHRQTHVHNLSIDHYLETCIPKDYDSLLFHGVVGGPPCQEFSILNRWPDITSKRANQLFVFIEAVKIIQPVFCMIENVYSIPKIFKDRAVSILKAMGYKVVNKQILAYNFGSVQLRKRWLLTASKDKHLFPNPISNSRKAKEILRETTSEMRMKPETRDQLKTLPTGRWVPLPGKRWKEYFIIDPEKPLPAIVNVMKNRIVRPDCSSYVSFDEVKLAQGFPEDYKMEGSLSSQAQQLANAIPVEVASYFAKEFFEYFHPSKNKLTYYDGDTND